MRNGRFALLICLGISLSTAAENGWNPKAAAAYLDERAEWWSKWPTAARDHGTFCISCHTALPYALSRSALRVDLGETVPSSAEQALTANIQKRVQLWDSVAPFYLDSADAPNRSAQSRGTEAVLNALILGSTAASGPVAEAAFRNLWAAQVTTGPELGSFLWIDFHNRPWEADDSQYYGSALAAVAVGSGPASDPSKVELLSSYLRRGFDSQSVANRLVVLWASGKMPGLLTADQKLATIRKLAEAQAADGGWSLTALAGKWNRRDATELETVSDGYATGLAAYALERAGVPISDTSLQRALGWLRVNQSPTDGRWTAYSLNKKRDLNSNAGKFMSDAATGYAVLALAGAR